MSEEPRGLLPQAIHRCSPNQDERPPDTVIDLLVIHNISLPPDEFGGPWIDDLFHNRLDSDAHPYFQEITDLKVSTHILIRRDGQLIQYVPLHCRAWHAGDSCFEGREKCNDFSIGIELEGSDDTPYTTEQYSALVEVTREIVARYPAITPQRIKGHCEIAPGRKSDPGPAFDWRHFRELLAKS